MLLDGEAEVLGLGEGGAAYVVRDRRGQLISVVGRPDGSAVREALFRSAEDAVVLCQPGEEEYVAPLAPELVVEPATLHILVDSSRLPAADYGEVRFVTARDLASAEMPGDLREELGEAILWSEMTATIVEGAPVAFCYVASATETLWDISIDTIDGHRRLGYAALAVARMIEHMYERGKAPVWGAEDSNAASMSLARKLGFAPVDRLMVLRRG